MKKWIHWSLLGLCLLLLSGCSQKTPGESTLAVGKKGELTYTIVEDFEKGFYDEEELRKEIEEEAQAYNKNFATDHLVVKDFQVEDAKASLRMEFDACRYFADYSGMELFVGSLKEAKAQGYEFSGEFMGADGALTDVQSLGGEELHVAILKPDQDLRLQVPKDILAVSLNSVIFDKREAKAEEGKTTIVVYK